ncbi:MAG: phytanoyl-CoA dioxygenase family protein [Candidatus Latescibacterota bacterium]|jgi:hypothetical protein|nr:phytanoyl-CoA dioxygenase family protein [Candidatus Latescibacterota bacterium]MEE3262248.1 phytanoyl-CoA dioxygenase family protein [Candidatus Latescibacterota bacterium]MEE3336227.1 phytanoyl-CoA dioxygenase family protein [Candidatus Latescibacterota bacterium]
MNDNSQSPTPTHYTAITDQILSEMDRDLSFHECGVAEPVALSHEQIETFNHEGFLSPIPLFGAHEISDIRSYFDDLLARVLAEGDNQYSISSAHQRHGRVHDLLCHPQITQIVGDLLGNRFVGWGSHFFCKLPGDGKTVSWHQDASYWPMTPSRTVTVWLAIDDADTENACMRFIPRSHVHGHLPYRESDAEENNVLNQTVDAVERFGDPFDVELEAGQMSVHSDLLLHGSGANRSTRRRCGLTLRYCRTEVRAHMGWNGKGVIIRGGDDDGHWADLPRPESD